MNNSLEDILNLKSEKNIDNINELEKLINEYFELQKKYNESSKYERVLLKDRLNDIQNKITYGIKIDNSVIDYYKAIILNFCRRLGIDESVIISKITGIDLTISPVMLLSKGKLCNYGDFISIDYSYAKYNSNGQFENLIEPSKNFFLHTLIHELLHTISRQGIVYMDASSEGMTDYFAHKMSKASNIISDKYGYMERIYYMFGLMIGDDMLFSDYVSDINRLPNVMNFLETLNVSKEEFKEFKKDLDLILKLKFDKNLDESQIKTLETKSTRFIFNRIIMPYCNFNEQKANEFLNKIFSNDEGVKNDLCEIHMSQENKTNSR